MKAYKKQEIDAGVKPIRPLDCPNCELEITASWKGQETLVSILCATYQHEAFIRDALNGFLMQKTNFPFEVIVRDDASTDGTAEIIEDYARKFPRVIRPILEKVNRYPEVVPGPVLAAAATGSIFAICEGDDFWIDPDKLMKQVASLRENPGADMSIHPSICVYFDCSSFRKGLAGQYRDDSGIVAPTDVIRLKFGQIPTASIVIRRTAAIAWESFRKVAPPLTVGDVYLQFFGASRGGAIYLNEPMSVYRLYVPGSYNWRRKRSADQRYLSVSSAINGFSALNQHTKQKFETDLKFKIKAEVWSFLVNPRNRYWHRLRILGCHYKSLSSLERLYLFPLTIIPGALSAVLSIKGAFRLFQRSVT